MIFGTIKASQGSGRRGRAARIPAIRTILAGALVATAIALDPFPVAADDCEQIALEPGDTAPAFSLAGSDGKTYTLEQFKGKKAVVIAWFPKAFTGG